MSLSKREMALIGILLFFGIIYAYYAYAYQPLSTKLDTARTENQGLEKEIQQLKNTSSGQSQSGESLEKIKSDFVAAATKLPPKPNLPEALSFMEKSSKDANVDLKSLQISDSGTAAAPVAAPQPGSAPATGAPVQQTYELAGTGGFFSFNSFLLKLEEAPRIFIISRIDIGSQPSSTSTTPAVPGTSSATVQTFDGSSLTFTMSLISYYDGIDMEDVGKGLETVQPSAGRNNPFSS